MPRTIDNESADGASGGSGGMATTMDLGSSGGFVKYTDSSTDLSVDTATYPALTGGKVDDTVVPDLTASVITSGTFSTARLPGVVALYDNLGNLSHGSLGTEYCSAKGCVFTGNTDQLVGGIKTLTSDLLLDNKDIFQGAHNSGAQNTATNGVFNRLTELESDVAFNLTQITTALDLLVQPSSTLNQTLSTFLGNITTLQADVSALNTALLATDLVYTASVSCSVATSTSSNTLLWSGNSTIFTPTGGSSGALPGGVYQMSLTSSDQTPIWGLILGFTYVHQQAGNDGDGLPTVDLASSSAFYSNASNLVPTLKFVNASGVTEVHLTFNAAASGTLTFAVRAKKL